MGALCEQGQAPQHQVLGSRQRELRHLGSGQEHPAARSGDLCQSLQGVLAPDEGRRSLDQDRRRGGAGRRRVRQLPRAAGDQSAHRPDSQRLDARDAGHAAATRRDAGLRGLSSLRTGTGRRKRSVPAQLGRELGERRGRSAPDGQRLPGSQGAGVSSSPAPSTIRCSAIRASRPPASSTACSTPMRWAIC